MTKSGAGASLPDPGASSWTVEFHDDFEPEFDDMAEDVQDGLLAAARAVQTLGPHAGRPYVDTLKGSRHANMKELRFEGTTATRSGVQHSHSTHSGEPSFWWPETSRERAPRGSTGS